MLLILLLFSNKHGCQQAQASSRRRSRNDETKRHTDITNSALMHVNTQIRHVYVCSRKLSAVCCAGVPLQWGSTAGASARACGTARAGTRAGPLQTRRGSTPARRRTPPSPRAVSAAAATSAPAGKAPGGRTPRPPRAARSLSTCGPSEFCGRADKDKKEILERVIERKYMFSRYICHNERNKQVVGYKCLWCNPQVAGHCIQGRDHTPKNTGRVVTLSNYVTHATKTSHMHITLG